ncbi:response regulator [Cyclobacterium xiamenense]|jgi:CheY-like chemotaxis protein|uniref:response regulator n=1 Tax=Cyclobacterium xiamenense TaxID=1297121 RepID=UPI0012B74B58|nr:response regulator [Cyclobacterium xiamenense]
MKVLVVEDDLVLRAVLKQFFTLKGHEVYEAADGRQGYQLLVRESQLDLIITDIMMPRMNGYEMIEAIKANPDLRGIPVIVITAGKIDSEKFNSSGANEIYQKPLALDQLLKKAETLIQLANPESNT